MNTNVDAYTKKEISIIKRHYPRHGAVATAKTLERHGFHRSPTSVTQKAREYCEFAEVPGYIKLIDVDGRQYNENRQTSYRALQAAKRDGVLLKVEAGAQSYLLVPVEWADEYVRESEALWQADEACAGVWWDSRRVAREFGLADRTIQNAMCGKFSARLGRAVDLITARRGVKQWYFEPGSVRRAARLFRSETRDT